MIKPGEIAVQLGGKERLIKFGLGSTKAVCEYHGIKLSEMGSRFNLDDLFLEEIYGGLVHALALENKKPDYNRAQVFDWIDAMPQEYLQRVFDVWLTTSQHGETRFEKFMKVIASMNPDDDAEKKKLTGQM
jgi:hypothetical protein